jgi:hypothetical protein
LRSIVALDDFQATSGPLFKAHPHMLRHAYGRALTNKGHDTRAIQAWLGHRSITSPGQGLLAGALMSIFISGTLRFPHCEDGSFKFKDFWRD